MQQEPITLHTVKLDGKHIAYGSHTVFEVQVGRGRGAYRVRNSFKGNLPQAVSYFNAINIGRGYKKRLFAPDMNNPVLAVAYS